MPIDNSKALIESAAYVMGVNPEEILGPTKTFAITLARQIVMTLWSESHSLQSASEIGGRKHHTAAVYARKNINARLQYCAGTRERVEKILRKYSEIVNKEQQTKQNI